MREYDGIEKRYQRPDADLAKSLMIIENLLGFTPLEDRLEFDLSFWAGGSGVLDKLAVSCSVTPEQMELAQDKLRLYSPEAAIALDEWRDDFIWLVEDEDVCTDVLVRSAHFINENKAPFQDVCLKTQSIYFAYMSDVNGWTAVWGQQDRLNYAYFCQG